MKKNSFDFLKKALRASRFWENNRLILRELRFTKKTIIFAILFSLSAAILEGLTVGLLASFLQGLTNPSAPPIQSHIRLIDTWFLAVEASPEARVIRLSLLLMVMVWLRSGFTYLGLFYSHLTGYKLIEFIRKRIYEQLQSLSLEYFAKVKTGELIDVAINQTKQLRLAAIDVGGLIIRGFLLSSYIVVMVFISWQLSVIAIICYSLLSVFVSWITRHVRELSFDLPKSESAVASIAMEGISGIRTIKSSASEDFEKERYFQSVEGVTKAGYRLDKIRDLAKPAAEGGATTVLICIILGSFLFLIRSDQLEAASLLTFMFVLFRMMPLVAQVNNFITRIMGYGGCLEVIQDILRSSNKPFLKNGTLTFQRLEKGIKFTSVDFQYDDNKLILQDIDIIIEQGKTTALVGASGAGKSTLADLIPRFYGPTKGKVFLDNVPLEQFDIATLRRKMSIVSQETFIFNRTIKDNIAYGLFDVSDEVVWEAARQANALSFIREMPEGLNTVLGDRGVRLSGGQRQRIAIARALLRNPDILILDEATSALDSITEKLIQDSIEKLSQGRTVVAIAHRLSTIANADKVVVLDNGSVVEQGTYKKLLQNKGALWKYHQAQKSIA